MENTTNYRTSENSTLLPVIVNIVRHSLEHRVEKHPINENQPEKSLVEVIAFLEAIIMAHGWVRVTVRDDSVRPSRLLPDTL